LEWEHFYCSHGLHFVKNYSFVFGSVVKINKVLLLLFTREMAAERMLLKLGTGNGERETENGKRETENGEREIENESLGTSVQR